MTGPTSPIWGGAGLREIRSVPVKVA